MPEEPLAAQDCAPAGRGPSLNTTSAAAANKVENPPSEAGFACCASAAMPRGKARFSCPGHRRAPPRCDPAAASPKRGVRCRTQNAATARRGGVILVIMGVCGLSKVVRQDPPGSGIGDLSVGGLRPKL